MDREQLIRDIADKFKADGYGWSQALDEAVHLVETVEGFGYTVTRPDVQEQRVLDAVKNWRPKPSSTGAMIRLMQEASVWLARGEQS